MHKTFDIRPLPYICGFMAFGMCVVGAAMHHATALDYAYVVPGIIVGFLLMAAVTHLLRHWLVGRVRWWRRLGAFTLLFVVAMAIHIVYAEVSGMYDHKSRELPTTAVTLGVFPVFMYIFKFYGAKENAQPK